MPFSNSRNFSVILYSNIATPLSSTITRIVIEGGKNLFSIPDSFPTDLLHHLVGTATKKGSGVNFMGNNLVKETRLIFLSQFCCLGPADLEEAGGPPS